jgi:acetylornithine aminotransferase
MDNVNLNNKYKWADDGHLMTIVQRYPIKIKGPGKRDGWLARYGGDDLFDCWADEGVPSMGYSKPLEMLKTFAQSPMAIHQLPNMYPHPHVSEAARLLCERTGMDKVTFANSGAEANEAAIKLARLYAHKILGSPLLHDGLTPEKHVIMTIQGNFHGRTGFALAACDPRISPYHRIGMGPIAAGFGVLTDDLKSRSFTKLGVDLDISKDNLAAVIMAPIMGNNTVKTYTPKFFRDLRQFCDDHDALLIFDEVQTGMGRSGHICLSGSEYTGGVEADIITLGKGIALGFPATACLAKADVAAAFTPGTHFNTFGGSPFVCWMITQMLDILTPEALEAIREKGRIIRDTFSHVDQIQSQVDGYGMLNAFTPDWEGYDGYDLCRKVMEHNVIVVTHRPKGPVRFTPVLNAGVEDIIWAIGEVSRSIQELK